MALFVHLYIHFSANVSDILNVYINVQTIFLSPTSAGLLRTAFFFAHRKHQTQDRKWTGKINKLQTIRRKLYDENKTKNKIRTPKRKLFISPSIMISTGLTGC